MARAERRWNFELFFFCLAWALAAEQRVSGIDSVPRFRLITSNEISPTVQDSRAEKIRRLNDKPAK
jgi:hypothetical protein